MFSLDFTVPSKLARPSVPASVQEAKPKLELTLEPVAPAAAPVEPAAPAVAPAPAFPVVHLDPVVEEAAQLFAAGNAAAARKTLETAQQGGKAIEAVWWMLFDLYRVLGEQETFDKLALEFAKRFEKSPPAWHIRPVAKASAAATSDGRASVALTGALNSRCAPQFAKLVTVAKTRSLLRLDLTKIQDADNGGCALLLGAIQYLKKTPCELVLGGAEHLADMLKGKVVSGRHENDAIWLLLLEIYQRLDQSDAFEAMALDYAITFEVSPPSWEAPKPSSLGAAATDELQEVSVEEEKAATLSLAGEMLDAGAANFAAIGAAFGDGSKDDVVVDLAQLKRIDQNSAMALQQTLSALPGKERRVRLTGCSHMVAALLEMAGVGKLATVERARL